MLVGAGVWEREGLHVYLVIWNDNALKDNGFIREYLERKVWRNSLKTITAVDIEKQD